MKVMPKAMKNVPSVIPEVLPSTAQLLPSTTSMIEIAQAHRYKEALCDLLRFEVIDLLIPPSATVCLLNLLGGLW